MSALGGAYGGFTLSAPPVREIAPTTLRVSASDGAGAVARMTDRIGATLWSTGRPQRGGEWIHVDFGAVVPVALIRWLPGTFQEVPRGVRLEASGDGVALARPSSTCPSTWGRSTGPRAGRWRACGAAGWSSACRRSRFATCASRRPGETHSGRGRSASSTCTGAAGGAPVPPVEADGAALARAIGAAGVRTLYADHGWASRIALADPAIRVPPANLQLDDYGFKGPAAMLLPPVRWEPGTGVLLEPSDAEGFAALAESGGLAFLRHALGGLVLFVHAPSPAPGATLPAAGLAVTASRHAQRAGLAVDGDPATRWATAAPRAAGDWFRVDLRAARVIRGMRLAVANPADLPPELAVEGSLDGVGWRRLAATLRTERRYRWGGFGLLNDGGATAVRLDFPPATLAALRVVLPAGDPVFDWSIHELAVYGGE